MTNESLEKILAESIENNKTEITDKFIKSVDEKIERFEENLCTVRKCLDEKDSYISDLEEKVKNLENNKIKQDERISELEKKNEPNEIDIKFLMDRFSSDEKPKSIEQFKCT